MVEVENLVKDYGDIRAVDNISFTVDKGEVLGFLGPNGAGKSTTMNIITGALSASSGTVTINSYDILEEPKKAKAHIGYLPETPPLYENMTVTEYLRFICDLKAVSKNKQVEHMANIMAQLKITNVRNRLIGNLSKGYRQRVGIAQALVGNPEVIILDEPTSGLDPKQIIDIRKVIRKLGEKHTVILSSHILSEVQETCDRVLIISNGKITFDGDLAHTHYSQDGRSRVRLTVKNNDQNVFRLIKDIPGIDKVSRVESGPNYQVYDYETVADYDAREEVFKTFAKARIPLIGMESLDQSLEDIFLKVTSSSYQYDLRKEQ